MRWLALLALVGCSQGDDCVVFGELFINSSDADTPMPTAAGGAQRFTFSTDACSGRMQGEVQNAVAETPSIATARIVDGSLEVTGVAAGSADVKVQSTVGGGDIPFDIVAIDHIALSGQTDHPTFATATPFAEIQLFGPGAEWLSGEVPCVDRTLTVTGMLRLGDRWDHLLINNAAPGDYPLTIHAGGKDWPVTITVTP